MPMRLSFSRNWISIIEDEVLAKFSGDTVLLEQVVSDFICTKAIAEFDSYLNVYIRQYVARKNLTKGVPKLNAFETWKIKKYLTENFGIEKDSLQCLDQYRSFDNFIQERDMISHNPCSATITIEKTKHYIRIAEEIIDCVKEILIEN